MLKYILIKVYVWCSKKIKKIKVYVYTHTHARNDDKSK